MLTAKCFHFSIVVLVVGQLLCSTAARAQTTTNAKLLDPSQFLITPHYVPEVHRQANVSHSRDAEAPVHYILSSAIQNPISVMRQVGHRAAEPDVQFLVPESKPLFQIELADADVTRYRNAHLGIPRDQARELIGSYDESGLYLPTIRQLGDGTWMPKSQVWASPNFFSGPLYFEQENVERYGHYVPGLQPVISGAHFFGSIVILPYKVGTQQRHEPVYSLGYYRPGSCNPALHSRLPSSCRGFHY